jgi:hypothetical protein
MGEPSRTVERLMMANENIQPGEETCTFSRSHTDLVDLLEAMTVAGWITSVPRSSVSGGGSSFKKFR